MKNDTSKESESLEKRLERNINYFLSLTAFAFFLLFFAVLVDILGYKVVESSLYIFIGLMGFVVIIASALDWLKLHKIEMKNDRKENRKD